MLGSPNKIIKTKDKLYINKTVWKWRNLSQKWIKTERKKGKRVEDNIMTLCRDKTQENMNCWELRNVHKGVGATKWWAMNLPITEVNFKNLLNITLC